MKIKKRDLQRLIESYLFEKVQIPSKVKAKGYTYELPGDGVIKITAKGSESKNIIILPKDAKEYNGKPLTKSMKRNKKYYEGIKEDIIGAEQTAEKYFEKEDSGETSDGEKNKINNLKERFDTAITNFLSALISGIDQVYGLSDNMIKLLTNGDSMIKSKNVSYKNKEGSADGRKRSGILNPFFQAEKQPTNTEKQAYKEMLENLTRLIYGGDLDNIQHDNTVEPYLKKLGIETINMRTRQAVGQMESVGKSAKLGDAGENYKDLEKFAIQELSSCFFTKSDF